jgi:hypothetical protein
MRTEPANVKAEIERNPRLNGLWGGPTRSRALGDRSLEIVPGKAIFFDSRLASASVALALVLRYGLEWQIWRERNCTLNESDIDVLALRAAAAYYALLTDKERDQCRSIAACPLREAIMNCWDRRLALDTLTERELAACAALRGSTGTNFSRNPTLEEAAVLAAPIEYILTSGCDSRSRFNPATGRIAYRSRPFPTPERFCFASSTAAAISSSAYARCERARQDLIQAAATSGMTPAFAEFADRQRRRMIELLDLAENEVDAVLCPSGTDAELFVLHIVRSILGTPLVNILTAVDETGRGSALAAQGRHFASLSTHDVQLREGHAIPELADGLESIPLTLHDERGHLKQADVEIDRAIRGAMADEKKVLLHVMEHSKFGSRCPNTWLLKHVQSRYRGCIQIVVDACQLRTSCRRLKWYLDQDCLVIITGSKFFGAPPFCGALLIPKKLAARVCDACLPSELADYSSRDEWPEHWVRIRSQLPLARRNVGLLFRWHAAIEGMSDYFAVPAAIREAAFSQFENEVSDIIRSSSFLELAPVYRTEAEHEIDDEMAHRSILPFFIVNRGRVLSPAESDVVYAALDRDITALLPPDASEETRRIAAQLCHVGQPVCVRHPSGLDSAILRMSAGATAITDNLFRCEGGVTVDMSREVTRAATVVSKIGLILEHLS